MYTQALMLKSGWGFLLVHVMQVAQAEESLPSCPALDCNMDEMCTMGLHPFSFSQKRRGMTMPVGVLPWSCGA